MLHGRSDGHTRRPAAEQHSAAGFCQRHDERADSGTISISPEGLRWNVEALRVQQEIGQRNAGPTLEARGSLYLLAGNPNDAIRCYASAHFQCSRLGRAWPQLPGTAELLAAARGQVSADESDEAWASGERLVVSDIIGAWARSG